MGPALQRVAVAKGLGTEAQRQFLTDAGWTLGGGAVQGGAQ